MISFLSGEIRNIFTEKSTLEIDVAGVGYEVVLPSFVMDDVVNEGKKSGENITLEIYYHSTERSPKPLLVGCNNQIEKIFFEKIIQVEGVGPLKAVSALIFPVAIVSQAIENEDLTTTAQTDPALANFSGFASVVVVVNKSQWFGTGTVGA